MRNHTRSWRGSVIADRNGWLVIKFRVEGRWRQRAVHLKDTPENRTQAARILAEVRDGLQAKEAVIGDSPGAVDVAAWAKRWLADRRRQGVADVDNDRVRLDLHVLPPLGGMPLNEVRPRHIIDMVNRLREAGRAPRTVRNVYGVAKAMFRDAALADLIDPRDQPCILTHRQLGRVHDQDPAWRQTAVFTRAELTSLLMDPGIPLARRVLWGLLGVGMLRSGEAAGLRWQALDLSAEPLGRISVLTSYDHGRTKTGAARWMPVHPALAALLAEWRLAGWAAEEGRAPEPGDLVCPAPRGGMRTHQGTYKQLARDLRVLGLRPRRVHDLRRTGISLARTDGADVSVLRRGTHKAPTSVMELYTTFDWETLCREVAKLKLTAPTTTVVALRGGRAQATPVATGG